MKKLPIGIQTFRKLIDEHYLYVDKTEHIHELIVQGSVYFLSRPRRFGKSLLISTLNDIFEGKKKLFKGLWIDNANYAWEKHPIVRIDFSKSKARNGNELINYIVYQLDKIALQYGIKLEQTQYDIKFDELLTRLSEINKVVVLIDEYDKPIIDNIENKQLAIELREILKGFYTIIKACDEYIRFVLLTGGQQVFQSRSFQRVEQFGRYFHGYKIFIASRNNKRGDEAQFQRIYKSVREIRRDKQIRAD